MKKIFLIVLTILLLTGCGEKTQLVCKQKDNDLAVTHEVIIEYNNEKPRKYIDKLIFDNEEDAKNMEVYANMGLKNSKIKREKNIIISEYTMNEYEETFNRYLKKKQFEKKYFEENNYQCE